MLWNFDLEADCEKVKTEREGFEPSVHFRAHRFSRPDLDSPKDQSQQEIRDNQVSEVPAVVPTPPEIQFPPDLAHEVAAWERLPDAIKAGVLALVEAAVTAHA